MCALHIEREPGDAPALALMSRLCLLGGDLAAAIAYASIALRAEPSNPAARIAYHNALAQRPNPPLALERFREALAIEPEIAAHAVCYAAAPPFAGIGQVRQMLEDAIRLDPALGAAHAALGNVLSRDGLLPAAIAAYRRAVDIDPQQPDAMLALSELLFDIEQSDASTHYRSQALAQKRFYPAGPRSANAARSVLVLSAPAPWAQNTPLEFMVDPQAAALHRLYLTDDSQNETLPPFDVIFNAIGEAERAHGAIARAQQFIDSHEQRVMNQPKHLWKTARPHLADALGGVHGCVVPSTRRITRDRLAADSEYSLLARPVDTHAGRGLERLDDAQSRDAYLARHPDERFDVVPFIEYRSADGFYRKYRVILVDGKPYPYHLAISPHWMVHYIKTPTASVEWMRAEEERFLRDPRSIFTNWERTFGEMARGLSNSSTSAWIARCFRTETCWCLKQIPRCSYIAASRRILTNTSTFRRYFAPSKRFWLETNRHGDGRDDGRSGSRRRRRRSSRCRLNSRCCCSRTRCGYSPGCSRIRC